MTSILIIIVAVIAVGLLAYLIVNVIPSKLKPLVSIVLWVIIGYLGYSVYSSIMKPINWNPDKNHKLIEERGISFEDVVFYLHHDGLLDDISHPNKDKYSHQRIFVVLIDEYVYLVPYVEDEKEIFLKTIIPSTDLNK